jgi:hypothetical protein
LWRIFPFEWTKKNILLKNCFEYFLLPSMFRRLHYEASHIWVMMCSYICMSDVRMYSALYITRLTTLHAYFLFFIRVYLACSYACVNHAFVSVPPCIVFPLIIRPCDIIQEINKQLFILPLFTDCYKRS